MNYGPVANLLLELSFVYFQNFRGDFMPRAPKIVIVPLSPIQNLQ